MTQKEREYLQQLIADFEKSTERCRHCCMLAMDKVDDPDKLCPKCRKIFEKAYDFEEEHAKFRLNDTEIAVGFHQTTGHALDAEELLRLKVFMLDFECEDSDNMAEAIKKVVMSLIMRNPDLAKKFTDD